MQVEVVTVWDMVDGENVHCFAIRSLGIVNHIYAMSYERSIESLEIKTL